MPRPSPAEPSTPSGTVTGLGSAVFVAIGAAIMLAYPLTEDRFRQIVGEVATRRAERAALAEEVS